MLVLLLLSQVVYSDTCNPQEIKDFIDQNVKAGNIAPDRGDEVYVAATSMVAEEKKIKLAEEISESINNDDLIGARGAVEKSNINDELKNKLFAFIDQKESELIQKTIRLVGPKEKPSVEEIPSTLEVTSMGAVLKVDYPRKPGKFSANNVDWNPKDEFHITMFFTDSYQDRIKQVHGLSNKKARDKAKEAMQKAVEGIAFKVKRTNNYRLIEKDGKKTIIELVDVEGLNEFYSRLEKELGIGTINKVPPHITIFVAQETSIGLTSQKDLEQYGRELTQEELDNLELLFNPAIELEKTHAKDNKVESSKEHVEKESKTLELKQLKRKEIELEQELASLENLWFWQRWFRNVEKEKAELNVRLQETKSLIISLNKESTIDNLEKKQAKPQMEIEEKLDLKGIKTSKKYQDQLKHQYVAVMTDIDGTITDENHQIPNNILEKIYGLILNNVPVAITTGRDKDAVKKIIIDLKKIHKNKGLEDADKRLEQALRNLFFFVQNGAYGFTAHNEEVVHNAPFPEHQVAKEEVKRLVDSLKLDVNSINLKEFSIVISLKDKKDLDEYTRTIDNKLLELGLPLNAINTGTTIDIVPKGVNKGLALERLVEILNKEYGAGITSNDVLRIGDNGQRNGNDYEMLKGFGGFSVGQFNSDVIPLIDNDYNQLEGYKASLWLLDNINIRKNSKKRVLHSPKTGKTLSIDDIVEQKELIPIKRERIDVTDEGGIRYTIWRPFLSSAEYRKAYVMRTDDIPENVDERSLLEDLIKKTEKEGEKYPEITSTLYDALINDYLATVKRASDSLKDHTRELEKNKVEYAILLPLMGAESLFTTMQMFNDFSTDKIVRVASSSSIFNRDAYIQGFLRDLFRKHKNDASFELIVLDEVISGSSLNTLNENIAIVLSQLKEEEIRNVMNNILADIKAGRENEVIDKYGENLKTKEQKQKFKLIINSIKKGQGGTYELYNMLKDLNYYTDKIRRQYFAVTSSDVGATKVNQVNYVKMRSNEMVEEFSMSASAIRLTEDASYAQAFNYKKMGSILSPQLEKKKDISDYNKIMTDFAEYSSRQTGRSLEEIVLSNDDQLLTPSEFGRNAVGQDMIVELLVSGKRIVMTFATIFLDFPGDTTRISSELVNYKVYDSNNKLEQEESVILKDNKVTKDEDQWSQLLKLRNLLNDMSKTLKEPRVIKITATTVYDRSTYELEYDDKGNVKEVYLLFKGNRISRSDIKDIIVQEAVYTFNTAKDLLAKIPVDINPKDDVLTKSELLEKNKERKARVSSELLKSQSLRKYVKQIMSLLDKYNYDEYVPEEEIRNVGVSDDGVIEILDLVNQDLEAKVLINEPIPSTALAVG